MLPHLSIDENVKNFKEYSELKAQNINLKNDLENIRSNIADLTDLSEVIKKPSVQRAIKQELINM